MTEEQAVEFTLTTRPACTGSPDVIRAVRERIEKDEALGKLLDQIEASGLDGPVHETLARSQDTLYERLPEHPSVSDAWDRKSGRGKFAPGRKSLVVRRLEMVEYEIRRSDVESWCRLNGYRLEPVNGVVDGASS